MLLPIETLLDPTYNNAGSDLNFARGMFPCLKNSKTEWLAKNEGTVFWDCWGLGVGP